MADNSVSMKLKLVTLLGEAMSEDVYEVVLPTKSGMITVLPDHEPLVTLLEPGAMAIRRSKSDPDSKLEFFAVSSGVVEVSGRTLVILADEAESDHEIAENEAEAAYKRAQKMHDNAKDQQELEEAKKMVSHQAARLKVASLRRQYRSIK